MNPFQILNIPPTDDKMAIRRAYVRECKLHHPDIGGDGARFRLIQAAYDGLIHDKWNLDEPIQSEVALPLRDLLNGAIAIVIIRNGIYRGTELEFQVPPYTYPGTYIEFHDSGSTNKLVRVKLLEVKTKEYTRIDSSVVIRHKINTLEAELGKTVEVTNFDGTTHTIRVSPETTADRLIYTIPGAGFYDKKSRIRGKLTIIVDVEKKGYLDV